jgi:hypothetical protein
MLRAGQSLSSDKAPVRTRAARLDQVSTESAAKLATELTRQPEIRPEVVERAKALAADPNYPPPEVMRRVGEMILGSPDLTEDES